MNRPRPKRPPAVIATALALCVSFGAAGCGPRERGRADGDPDAAADGFVHGDGAAGDARTDGTTDPIDGTVPEDAGPDVCAPISGVSYVTSPTAGPVTDRPALQHADLNVKLRGWELTGGTLGLVSIPGPTDTLAPKLNTLFADHRVPTFVQNYRVYNWDWNSNSRADLITDPEVTMVGMAVSPAEVLHLPRSGYDIGGGLGARVLLVDDDSITLKYTSDDNVVLGYTIHVVGVCVEPSLRALYESMNTAGRTELPALYPEQPFGRARSGEILVSIRDTGAFMDPRSDKDWW
jgi:hypothetical protein